MSKIIAVVGATGLQGGGVVNALLKEGSWKVRALTRTVNSEKAKALASQGVEIIQADASDEESLVKAFQGATAVYGMTQFWEYIMQNGPERAGEIEHEQGVNMANAAAKTPSLEHYIFATLPSASQATNGKVHVPHMDYKAKVDVYIQEKLPELAKKTTYVWHGMYSSNLAFFPNLKPTFYPPAGKHVIFLPIASSTVFSFVGDVPQNTGVFVKAILEHPSVSKGQYIIIATDQMSFGDLFKLWSKVTGKPCVYLNCDTAGFCELFPVFGDEVAQQFEWNKLIPDLWWNGKERMKHLEKEDLGIKSDDLNATEETLKSLVSFWE